MPQTIFIIGEPGATTAETLAMRFIGEGAPKLRTDLAEEQIIFERLQKLDTSKKKIKIHGRQFYKAHDGGWRESTVKCDDTVKIGHGSAVFGYSKLFGSAVIKGASLVTNSTLRDTEVDCVSIVADCKGVSFSKILGGTLAKNCDRLVNCEFTTCTVENCDLTGRRAAGKKLINERDWELRVNAPV